MGDILTVPFEERLSAFNNGAIFVRGSIFSNIKNHWEISDETPLAKADELRRTYGESKKAEVQKKQASEIEWAKALSMESTIACVTVLHEYGLPESEYDRIRMLRIFRNHKESELHIPWDCIVNYSEAFAEKYGPEAIGKYMRKYRLGENIRAELMQNSIPEEVKEIIRFVIPSES